MDWKDTKNYFQTIPDGFLSNLYKEYQAPWSPLERLKKEITAFFEPLTDQGKLAGNRKLLLGKNNAFREGSWFITETMVLDEDFIDSEFEIFLGKGTLLEAGATIKNSTIVESDCEIRQGAYLRGNLFIGHGSVVGHTTEMKNSIFFNHVEAGHFAYIGDSIVGAHVNLGAGTKLSNLQFRSLSQKRDRIFPETSLLISGEKIETGKGKFGAVIGDGSETGCNSVLSPFVFLGKESWVVPSLCVLKGVYPERTLLKNISDCKRKLL